MRVVVQRDSVGRHADQLVQRAAKALQRLLGKPVYQVGVDGLKFSLAAVFDGFLDHFQRLDAVDGLLYGRIEVLPASPACRL